jgi:type VII secretion-associated serine protease mycosin
VSRPRGRARPLLPALAASVLVAAGGALATGPAAAARVPADEPSATATATATGSGQAGQASTECKAGTVVRIPQSPPALAMMQGDLLASTGRGAGVLVAVVDSGVDVGNAHLTDAVTGGVDLVGGVGSGTTDVDSHGTKLAGIIAARGVDGSGLIGVAPQAALYSVRVYTDTSDKAQEAGTAPSAQRTAEGIRAAVDAGAQVINVSISTPDDDPALRSVVEYAVTHGSLVVASAGNWGTATTDDAGPRYPAAYPGALAVAAVDAAGLPSDNSIHGEHVDVAAPGANVLTTFPGAGDCVFGTEAAESSYATAYAAGAAALVAGAHPDESPEQWAYRLEATAVRPDPDRRDDEIGWGVVQPYQAVTLVPGPAVRGPQSPFGSGDGPVAQTTTAPPLVLSESPRPWTQARAAGAAAIAVTAVTLGALLPVVVLRRRRRDAAATTSG